VYLGRFSDSDHRLEPTQRIATVLGDTLTSSALAGLSRVLERPDIPDARHAAEVSLKGEIPSWWLAIIAGLDARWLRQPALEGLPERLIQTALAVDLVCPTSEREGNTSRRKVFGWKHAALSGLPHLARDVYLNVAKVGLDARHEHVEGLGELLEMDAFAWCRATVALSILGEYPNASNQHLRRMLEVVISDESTRDDFLSLARKYLAGGALTSEAYAHWLTAAFTSRPDEFESPFFERAKSSADVLWLLRDSMSATPQRPHTADGLLKSSTLERMALAAAHYFPDTPHPAGGWSGDRNLWDGAEFIKKLTNLISIDTSADAVAVLNRLASEPQLATYREYILHAAANQRTRKRDAEYRQPDWAQTVVALSNGVPANVADLHALLVDTLLDIADRIANANNNIYKRFWNEDKFGKVLTPKPEESGRDVLIDFLRDRLQSTGITIEPEIRMVHGKRADLSASYRHFKIPVELKRSYHDDVWHAPVSQLDRLYTRDPDASGYGVYGVFWFGVVEGKPLPRHPKGRPLPTSAIGMAALLRGLLPEERRSHIEIVVIDVSGQPRETVVP
jgi:hypothetical protein